MAGPIVILTGAGISAESGIRTFRASDGLWEEHRIEDVATPEGFARDPDLVLRFYNERRETALKAQPNPAHTALARLEREWAYPVLIVTQNVDDLHERAGSEYVLHMHGSLRGALCGACCERWEAPLIMNREDQCAKCGAQACRPDIVWFGEMPYYMEKIEAALEEAWLFVSIGTSGRVYPAAGFVQLAAMNGAKTLELNLDPSEASTAFDHQRLGPAGEVVPGWVNELITA